MLSVVSQLRQKSGSFDPNEETDAQQEEQQANGFESDSSQKSQSTNLQSSVSANSINNRHKPFNQTNENFSAVVSFSQLKCLLCKKAFSARKNLVHHARLFHREAINGKQGAGSAITGLPFKCKICGHQFQWKSSLWRHKKEKHSSYLGSINDVMARSPATAQPNQSHIESRSTNGAGTEELSVSEHSNVPGTPKSAYVQPLKPFKCDFCDVRFSGHKARRKHIRCKHPDSDPMNNGRTGGVLLDLSSKEFDEILQERQVSASPPGLYPCTDCGAQFRIKSSMMSHRARKHGKRDSFIKTADKAYQCDICGACFNLELSLKVHITKKHGRQPVRPSYSAATVTTHNYETKSATRVNNAIAARNSSSSNGTLEGETFVVQSNELEDNELEMAGGSQGSDSESKFSCGSSSSSGRQWVNPRQAEYEKYSDISTLTCKLCFAQYDTRKKLFLHLNRTHLSNQGTLLTPEAFEEKVKVEDVVYDDDDGSFEGELQNGSAFETVDGSGRASRKVRNYSKICDFDTLSCKLCPRQCNSMSQLQNHALYKHLDMIELVPMKHENGMVCDDQTDSMDLTLTKDDAAAMMNVDISAKNSPESDKATSASELSPSVNGDMKTSPTSTSSNHSSTSGKRSSSIYFFGDYIVLETHTCLLCNKSLTTTSNLLRHMVTFHKNVLGSTSNGKPSAQEHYGSSLRN